MISDTGCMIEDGVMIRMMRAGVISVMSTMCVIARSVLKENKMAKCNCDGEFTSRVSVTRLTDRPGEYAIDLTVVCNICLTPLKFIGLQAGISPDEPTCDPFGTEARLPARSLTVDSGDSKRCSYRGDGSTG
jgi:hypothetical protein